MKSQGLPLNFIVLGALALLVLVVAVAFFIAGGSTFSAATTMQTAQSTCNNKCSTISSSLQREASTVASGFSWVPSPGKPTPEDDSENNAYSFCRSKFNIQGQGEKFCDDIVSCVLTFGDGTNCRLECDDWNPGDPGYASLKGVTGENSGQFSC